MKRTAVRWLGAGFAVALAGLGVAPPALAQEPTTVNAVVDDATVAVGGTGRTLNVVISVAPGAAVNDLHLTLSVPDFVQLTVETGFFTCTAEAGTTECQWSGGFPISGVAGYPGFTLAAGPLAVAGQTGELSVTTSGSDVIGATHTSKVTVGEGVDLVASLGPELTSAPGGQLTGTFVVGNAGASPVFGAVLRVFEPYALPPTQRHSNCMYRGDDVVSCGFDTVLEPGKAYRAEMAFEVRTDTQAPSNQAVQNLWLTPADWADSAAALVRDGGSLGTPGTGPALALVETTAAGGAAPAAATLPQTDVTPEDAFSFFEVAITG
ncbi:MAG TPA: hypothetical protein VFE14_16885, partial [Micromonosporaceae bacterium]|nr:hypothetical protein [Micromonosporaceae bacterium]